MATHCWRSIRRASPLRVLGLLRVGSLSDREHRLQVPTAITSRVDSRFIDP